MKVRVKDEMDEIILKVNHKELVLISEALYWYIPRRDCKIEELNDKLFDKDEFKDLFDVDNKVTKMANKILRVLSKINPW
jgi:hypothetical protein